MKVLVGIPTYGNVRFGYTIRETLEGLVNQTFKDFRVLIVYKPMKDDKTLDVVSEYSDKLDVEVLVQRNGYFVDAVNMILEVARDYDITLTTDDDAIPGPKWVAEHISMHRAHEKIGVLSGLVNNSFRVEIGSGNKFLAFIKKISGFYTPLFKDYIERGYIGYINDIGLSVINPSYDYEYVKHRDKIYGPPIGVNMSFKSRLLDNFGLPPYSIKGLHNENLLATYYLIKYKMYSSIFRGANVIHLERESLSRAKSKEELCKLLAEHCLLPYGLYSIGVKVNMRKLKLYSLIKPLYSRLKETYRYDGCLYGIRLAIEAIENNYTPLEVRNKLKNSIYNKCKVNL
ncbi:glycosyltransferase family A protein [Staphylothermus hellenicus]|uniref:Glycosyl transferase family 2 n=1 Tax=Staphylothermus hellenicus (strain DSM 12710 / JCM 10830 / BK20S6-10-b1 / P8) TaxID=591019 RepID=D7DA10_STAHD|nr:glycosyltransferase family A protein [Staphylothermus hellenicus]ADI32606.1 glycosyl transferase family 2 [Staphylothermus hellenicus DSM 12710]